MHAVDDLEDALAATRAFLLPLDAGRWLRLAVLALFASAGTGPAVPTPFQFGFEAPATTPDAGPPFAGGSLAEFEAFLRANAALLAGALALVVAVALLAWFVGAVFEFGLYAALRDESVSVRRTAADHAGRGARLFGFRLALALLTAGPLALVVAGIVASLGFDVTPVAPLLLALALPVALVVALVGAVVYVLTTAFVVPTMLAADCGVLAGWRRVWATMTANPAEYGVFVLVGAVLAVAAATVVGTVAGIPAAVVGLPLVAVGGVAVVALDGAALVAVLAVLAVVWVVVTAAVTAVVQVPVQVFFRYYALLVLGDTDPDLDLIPERRAAVR